MRTVERVAAWSEVSLDPDNKYRVQWLVSGQDTHWQVALISPENRITLTLFFASGTGIVDFFIVGEDRKDGDWFEPQYPANWERVTFLVADWAQREGKGTDPLGNSDLQQYLWTPLQKKVESFIPAAAEEDSDEDETIKAIKALLAVTKDPGARRKIETELARYQKLLAEQEEKK